MGNKDLTKEYLNKILDSAIYFKKGNFPDMPLYIRQKSIIDAFNAGRESVLENIPKLEWKECICNNDEYFASCCPAGRYKVSRWRDLFEVWCNAYFICYRLSLSEAKQAANEHFKQTLKQALKI